MNQSTRDFLANYKHRVNFYIDDVLVLTSNHSMGKKFISDQLDDNWMDRFYQVTITRDSSEYVDIHCKSYPKPIDDVFGESLISRRVIDGWLYEFSRDYHNLEHRNVYHTECDFCEIDHIKRRLEDIVRKTYDIPEDWKDIQTREAFRLEELNHKVNHKKSNYCGFCRTESIMKELKEKQRIKTPWNHAYLKPYDTP